jgi:hypothetical protein
VRLERLNWIRNRWAVDGSIWQGRIGRESLADGKGREFKPDGRQRFVLLANGVEIASAGRAGRQWVVKAAHATYVLSGEAVLRHGVQIGSVRRVRRSLEVSLPDDVPADVQAFIGLLYSRTGIPASRIRSFASRTEYSP